MLTLRQNIILVLAIVIITTKTTQGIRCWVCDGKRTLKECHAQHGRMLTCPNADDVCQNDFRTAEGKPLITKGCKQAKACDTEVKQNKDKNQCGRKRLGKNLVCRCCCATDACNSKKSGCLPPPAPCKKLKSPRNGQAQCPNDIDFGSQCFIRCRQGYEIKGPARAVCKRLSKGSKKGKWNPEKPTTCEKIIIQCDPPRTAPKNGFVNCVNSKEYASRKEFNYDGTKCTYGCKKNFYLKGKKNTVCGNNKRWSEGEPTCEIGQCEIRQTDPNRIRTCTDGVNFGSECKFSCKKGYNLIGNKNSDCQQDGQSSKGYWTRAFPACAEVVCSPELTNPSNGKVSCTKGNIKDSVCTYTCDRGYDLDDITESSVTSVCEDDGDGDAMGEWSRKPATCSRIKCEPALTDPVGGQVVCTNRNVFGSVCEISCDSQHDLEETTKPSVKLTCQGGKSGNYEGEWSGKALDCKPITCEPAFQGSDTTRLSCTNGNAKDSVCTFECATEYDMEGTVDRLSSSTCQPPTDGTSVGTWSRAEMPTCNPITCSPQPFPENGFRVCSTFNFVRGTFCIFQCLDGYDRIGQRYMSCENTKNDGDAVGEWNSPTPTCRLGQCTPTKYDKKTVIEDCTPPEGHEVSEYRVGTVCEYRCISDAYYMVPNLEDDPVLSGITNSECDIEKRWTSSPPRCLKKSCLPMLLSVDNGFTPRCTDGNLFGSTCTFSCSDKYALTQELPLVCEADGDNDEYGKWSNEIPTCKRSHCDDFGTVLHGKIDCTDGSKIGSVCSLKCIDRYIAKRYDETECLNTALWSRRRYYCCVRCLFNKRLEIVTMFDSTAFKSKSEWENIVDFTESYLEPMVENRLDIVFSGFSFNAIVDSDSEIPKRRVRRPDDVDEVTLGLKDMPYGGTAAYLGRALEHVKDDILKRFDKRREHFIIIATTGKSLDEVADIAKQLRDMNVNILAVGFNLDSDGRKQLLEITGSQKNIFAADKAEDMREIPSKIFDISRSSGCSLASKTQPCP